MGSPPIFIRRTNAANHLENAWAKFERAEVDIEAFDQLFAAESRLGRGGSRQGRVCRCYQATCGPKGEAPQAHQGQVQDRCITKQPPRQRHCSASGRVLYIAEVMALFDHVIESPRSA